MVRERASHMLTEAEEAGRVPLDQNSVVEGDGVRVPMLR